MHGFIVNHPEGELDLLLSADRRQGATEQPGGKHQRNAGTSDDPASLLAAVVAEDDAKPTAFGK